MYTRVPHPVFTKVSETLRWARRRLLGDLLTLNPRGDTHPTPTPTDTPLPVQPMSLTSSFSARNVCTGRGVVIYHGPSPVPIVRQGERGMDERRDGCREDAD